MRVNLRHDNSNIDSDYDLVRVEPNGPSILRKSQTNLHIPHMVPSYSSVTLQRMNEPNLPHFMADDYLRMMDDGSFDFIRRFIVAWNEPVTDLLSIWFESQNKETQPITERAFRLALSLMVYAFVSRQTMPPPDITLSGDGGVDIEWESDKMALTVHVRKSSERGDRVYLESNGNGQSSEFNIDSYLSYINKFC